MAGDDHVADAELLDRELDDRHRVRIGRQDDVCNVAVHEHFTRREADDLVRRDPAVGAADPEVIGLLDVEQTREIERIGVRPLARPRDVVGEKIRKGLHWGRSV